MTKIRLTPKALGEVGGLDDNLRQIFNNLINLWEADTLEVTSIHRTREHDRKIKGLSLDKYVPGVHTVGPPYRALDASVYALGPTWPRLVVKYADLLNDIWVYDPFRPDKVVCYVKPHGTGPHIHLQTHPNTRRKS